MIQRIQSIWLLLASLAAFMVLRFPFYYASTPNALEITGSSTTGLLITLAFSACISFISIFLFGNRMLQVKATILNLLLSIVIGYLVFRTSTANPTGGFTIYSIALFALPLLQILAIVKIYKDERLVKSADRLR